VTGRVPQRQQEEPGHSQPRPRGGSPTPSASSPPPPTGHRERRISDLVLTRSARSSGSHASTALVSVEATPRSSTRSWGGSCGKHAACRAQLRHRPRRHPAAPAELARAEPANVFERMRAERGQDRDAVPPEGEREFKKVVARGRSEKTADPRRGLREAERTKGEGDARAMRIYAEASSRTPALQVPPHAPSLREDFGGTRRSPSRRRQVFRCSATRASRRRASRRDPATAPARARAGRVTSLAPRVVRRPPARLDRGVAAFAVAIYLLQRHLHGRGRRASGHQALRARGRAPRPGIHYRLLARRPRGRESRPQWSEDRRRLRAPDGERACRRGDQTTGDTNIVSVAMTLQYVIGNPAPSSSTSRPRRPRQPGPPSQCDGDGPRHAGGRGAHDRRLIIRTGQDSDAAILDRYDSASSSSPPA